MLYLRQHIDRIDFVRISRSFPGDMNINGFIHAMSEHLLLVQQFYDFFNEGYIICRKKDVVEVSYGEEEEFFKEMLIKEGLFSQVKVNFELPLNCFNEVIQFFIEKNDNVIVEIEHSKDENEDSFFIGRPIELKDGKLWFHEFNAIGEWAAEEVSILVDNITNVQFDTPYINIFSKYVSKYSW